MNWQIKNRRTAMLFIAPACLVIIAGIAYPIGYNIYKSMFSSGLSVRDTQNFVGLQNYVNVLSSKDFWAIFKNTLIWTLGLTLMIEIFALSMAIMLNENIRGRAGYRVIALLSWVIPGVVAGIIWQYMLDPIFGAINDVLWRIGLLKSYVSWLGQTSTSLGAVMLTYIWKVFPMPMIMILATLQSIPHEIYEAAKTDGASRWQSLRFITLPMLKGIVATTSILMMITAFNSFDLIYIMTGGGPLSSSETLAMYIYNLAFSRFNYSRAAAVAIIMFVIATFIIFFYIRSINKKEDGAF